MREHVNDQTVERDRYVIKVLCRLWLLNSAEIWAGTACNQSMTKKDSVSIVRLRKGPTQVHNPLQAVAAHDFPPS